jgi:CO/xanthine dehydrogenase Mo-binding subunit
MMDLPIEREIEKEEKVDSDEFRIINDRDSDEFKIRDRIDSHEYRLDQKESAPNSEMNIEIPSKPPKPEAAKEDKNDLMGIQIRDSFDEVKLV